MNKFMEYELLGFKRTKHHFEPPLLKLVRQIPQRYRSLFVGVTLDHRLGFVGARQFRYLNQAVIWMESNVGIANAYKRPLKLTLDQLLSCSSHTPPESIVNEIRSRLSREL